MNIHTLNAQLRSAMDVGDRRQITKHIKDFTDDLVKVEHSLFPDERTAKMIGRMSTEDSLQGYAEKYALELEF